MSICRTCDAEGCDMQAQFMVAAYDDWGEGLEDTADVCGDRHASLVIEGWTAERTESWESLHAPVPLRDGEDASE